MNEAANLVTNEALLVLGSMLIAMICALPGFIIDFFVDLGRKKHWIFFALAFCVAAYLAFSKNEQNALYTMLNVFLNLLVIYFGLLLLKAFKNMGSRFGMCKICDKIKSRLRRSKIEQEIDNKEKKL